MLSLILQKKKIIYKETLMKNDKITSIQYATLTFFMLTSFFMNSGFYILIKISKNDSLFSILLGGVLILLFQFFIFYIRNLFAAIV